MALTANEVSYYAQVCDEYEAASPGEDIEGRTGLSRSAACDWAIFGYTVQGSFENELTVNRVVLYVRMLERHIDYLMRVIRALTENDDE